MKIIFAQGNPDTKYVHTRHNTGFLVLDAFGEKHGATWRDIDKYKGRISDVMIGDEKVLLVKPLSYYNDTGLVARTLADYYKLDPTQDFLVVHDDLALPLGTIRVRENGSDAGNNGIKSLNAHLGADYKRIRIGIWTDQRDRMDDVNFVLGTFPKEEFDKLEKDIIPHTIALIEQFVAGTLEASSTSV
jgi:PTH1 family peptidyl-tRNA hydrolase